MSSPPLLTLDSISLTLGGKRLFDELSLAIGQGERLCLVGRNGTGKSTLLRTIAGLVEPDFGRRFMQPGLRIGYLHQEPDFASFATLGAFAAADLAEDDRYQAEIAMDGLEVKAGLDPGTASGGERRRAALARLLAGMPALLLLDEPTNHLDVKIIAWLEAHLASIGAAFVLISHDRRFLQKLTRTTIWLDRGRALRLNEGFSAFESWRDKTLEDEREQRHKLDRLIKSEARWAVEGITARRKRNMGRVRRLADLRSERRAQIAEIGRAAMQLSSGALSGKLVIEARAAAKSFDDHAIIAPFSTRIHRGDRVALVGPNGAGKTTMLNLLTAKLAPDSGEVRLGSNVGMARLDQDRGSLEPQKTLWETLTGDRLTRVSGHADQVMVRGRPQHVVGYLKSFLFDENQVRGPVSALSGGERARLLLAQIMARQSNLLILDEPTNDLDIETLDLLQELLADYDGTVLLVSHDRDFIDRVATSVLAPAGEAVWLEYAGGWSDFEAQCDDPAMFHNAQSQKSKAKTGKQADRSASQARKPAQARARLTYAQRIRLQELPAVIDRLTGDIARLEQLLADPELFARTPEKFQKAIDAMTLRRRQLDAAENEWLELEERKEDG